MSPCYDIYGLSKNRNRQTIENFLNHFCYRDKIEDREGQEIFVYSNEKYKIEEVCTPIKTMTEVIDYGLLNRNHGFAFYISDHLKNEVSINQIILKFTYDGKMIFGVSVDERIRINSGDLIDNFEKAQAIEKKIAELTGSTKTSIQFEYAPSDDEDEFDEDVVRWQKIKEEKHE
jgi:hypothetical protein